jgi:predicted O-methyltransferase YrrM
MRDIEDVSRIAATVEGWLSDAQGRALYAAAAAARSGAIVEIGSWKGRSTVWLACGAQRSGRRVHAVDPHAGSLEDPRATTLASFRTSLERAGVSGQVHEMVMTSAEAARRLRGPVELLFVDGDHSPDGAARDADLWLPRVRAGGVVMFHDVATSGYAGPRRVFQRRICWSGEFHRIRKVGSMGIAERTPRRSPAAAARATLVGLLLYFYDLEGTVKRLLRRLRRALGFDRPPFHRPDHVSTHSQRDPHRF